MRIKILLHLEVIFLDQNVSSELHVYLSFTQGGTAPQPKISKFCVLPQIINTFLKNDIRISNQIVQGTQK